MQEPNQQNRDVPEKETTSDNAIIQQKIVKINGETIIKKYSKGKLLGRGGFAKCYEITNLENKKVLAAKIISKASLNKNRAKQKVFQILNSQFPKSKFISLYIIKIQSNFSMYLKITKMYTSFSRFVLTKHQINLSSEEKDQPKFKFNAICLKQFTLQNIFINIKQYIEIQNWEIYF